MVRGVVGLIVNPAAGKDIRRLVAHAQVVEDVEKSYIVAKILSVLEFFGVKKIIAMPEGSGIISRALSILGPTSIDIEYVSMRLHGDWTDTYRAAEYMKNRVDAIVVIGGDGTNRILAKAGIEAPVMPISTGTNNVFPYMVEATIAGAAVAAIALGVVRPEESTFLTKRLDVYINGKLEDVALIDVAATLHQFVGTKAVWRTEYITELATSVATPHNIGLSSIAGVLTKIEESDDYIAYVRLKEGGNKRFACYIGPGALKEVSIDCIEKVKLGEPITFVTKNGTLALDGERTIELFDQDVAIIGTRKGLRVIDYRRTLELASYEREFFRIKSSQAA